MKSTCKICKEYKYLKIDGTSWSLKTVNFETFCYDMTIQLSKDFTVFTTGQL